MFAYLNIKVFVYFDDTGVPILEIHVSQCSVDAGRLSLEAAAEFGHVGEVRVTEGPQLTLDTYL